MNDSKIRASASTGTITLRERVAFAMLMGLVTTGIISFGLVSASLGFDARFMRVWLRSWALAYAIVIPLILIFAPRVQAFVDSRFAARWAGREPSEGDAKRKKIAFALSMGSVTTGVISFSLIAANLGFQATFVQAWLRAWAMSYVAVIPALLFIAPRIQSFAARTLGKGINAQASARPHPDSARA
jgi:hypothetical protein